MQASLFINLVIEYMFFNLQLESIADRTLSEADRDGDREITFEEFCKVSTFYIIYSIIVCSSPIYSYKILFSS